MNKVLLTGASGKLGSELSQLIKRRGIELLCPTSDQMNIVNFEMCKKFFAENRPSILIHSAAFTDVTAAESDSEKAMEINIMGTINMLKLCNENDVRMVFISTDYVFDGEKGNYKVTDPINPITKYAKSKASAELAVRMFDNTMTIRTSFYGKMFPYTRALTDQWTSKDYVDIIAPKVLDIALSDEVGIVHCGSTRRSVFEIAKTRNNDVIPITRNNLPYFVPKDTSLEINK